MELPCIVEYVRYRGATGFAILSASLNALSAKYSPMMETLVDENIPKNKYDNFTVSLGMLDVYEKPEGRQYIFVGEFTKHPKYGPQFKAEFYYQDEPKTKDGLQAYLMTLPNIKESRSAAIINTFSVEEIIRILDEEPMKLTQINGLTEQRIPPIKEAWDRDKALRELYVWLGKHQISPALGKKVYDRWKHKSLEILNENPYRLIEIRGVGFIMADVIAHKIMKQVNREFRAKACMLFVLNNDVRQNSNLCMPYAAFKQKVIELLRQGDDSSGNKEIDYKLYLDLIPYILKSNMEDFMAVKELTDNGVTYIYLSSIWEKEKYIAQQIFKRHQYHSKDIECSLEDINHAEKDVSHFSGKSIELDDTQKEAIASSFKNRMTVITGGGGTGKSTICRCIFHLAQEKGLSIRMMSPTGKAAQVLGEKTGCEAATIHRSLRMKPDDDFPRERINEDIVIVDEISMCGIDTMFAVMSAMEENIWAHVVFVGDANQLPSVSPGNFLSDMMQSGCVNVVKLDKIHRQDEHSYISLLANQISMGKIVEIPDDAIDIKWHHLNADQFEEELKSKISATMHEMGNINQLQVISPMYKGLCGVNKINEIIQAMMAEHNGSEKSFVQFEATKFHMGDRVIQIDNNYEKQVFNGDIGHIVDLGEKVIDPKVSDKKERFIIVNFYGDEHCYLGNDMEQLRLAWCITVHKFQGSQAKRIIFVMAQEQRIMMSKELVYTAFTRAEKQLDIFGHTSMLQAAPMRSIVRKRYTNMNRLIQEFQTSTRMLKVMKPHNPVPSL